MQIINPSKLSFKLIDPCVQSVCRNEAYRCWHDTWVDAMTELDQKSTLHSDDFTRQDEIGVIFHDDECIALSFFRWLSNFSHIDTVDSYFRVWPQDAIEQACIEGKNICVSSYFTLAKEWRRNTEYSLKDINVALIIEVFKKSGFDAVVGTVRNNRGVDKLIYRNGFTPIMQNMQMYGVDVDLAAFYKSNSRLFVNENVENVVNMLKP